MLAHPFFGTPTTLAYLIRSAMTLNSEGGTGLVSPKIPVGFPRGLYFLAVDHLKNVIRTDSPDGPILILEYGSAITEMRLSGCALSAPSCKAPFSCE